MYSRDANKPTWKLTLMVTTPSLDNCVESRLSHSGGQIVGPLLLVIYSFFAFTLWYENKMPSMKVKDGYQIGLCIIAHNYQ